MLTSSQVIYKEIDVFEMLRLPIDLFNKSVEVQLPKANIIFFNIKDSEFS